MGRYFSNKYSSEEHPNRMQNYNNQRIQISTIHSHYLPHKISVKMTESVDDDKGR